VRAERQYFVYILASKVRRLYVGMTNDLERRGWQHRTKVVDGFTSRYNIDRLVWYESTDNVLAAIEREKEIKAWRREKKVRLIEAEKSVVVPRQVCKLGLVWPSSSSCLWNCAITLSALSHSSTGWSISSLPVEIK
jgi:putative endonuclease